MARTPHQLRDLAAIYRAYIADYRSRSVSDDEARERHGPLFRQAHAAALQLLKSNAHEGRGRAITVRGVRMRYEPELTATKVGGDGDSEVVIRQEQVICSLTALGERLVDEVMIARGDLRPEVQ